MNQNLKMQLNFITEVDKMKTILRQNLLFDKSRRENDAEHSWHLALTAVSLIEHAKHQGIISLERVLKMALIHDIVEVYAGDTFAYDVKGYEDKNSREIESAKKIFGLLPEAQAKEYYTLWEEFDKMESYDARYASAIDRLIPFMANHLTDGHTWAKYGVKSSQVYKRMDIVKSEIPDLWEFVEEVIATGIKNGHITKDI